MKNFILTGALLTAVFFAVFPETVVSAAGEALHLCAHHLLPSLFPFFVCANVLLQEGFAEKAGKLFSKITKKVFRINGAGAAAICLGFISGYPAGAVVSSNLFSEGAISKSEAERLLAFTNNPGPLFILGTVGTSLYQSKAVGTVLYVSVIAASVLTGALMRFYGKNTTLCPKQTARKKGDPMGEAIFTVLTLCGYVVFFAVVVAFLEKFGVLKMLSDFFTSLGMPPKTARLVSFGIFEISTAAKSGGALPAMAALLSFGGLSVFLQTAAIVKKVGLSVKPYLMGKFLSATLSEVICSCILKRFPLVVEAAKLSVKTAVYIEYLSLATAMAISVYLLYRLLSKFCR